MSAASYKWPKNSPAKICRLAQTSALLVMAFTLSGVCSAQSLIGFVPTGANSSALAVNPVTNKIYVANLGSNNVTVIDGASGYDTTTYAANTSTNIQVGALPTAVAANPLTNKIYVANSRSNSVTVIDGATNSTTTVAVGTSPGSLAINEKTNKIYVANTASNSLTVIDGLTNSTSTVATGQDPTSIAVNPVTNRIYVTNGLDSNVSIIDGVTFNATKLYVGSGPFSVAVNPFTNRIYVAITASGINNYVAVINGDTNSVTNVSVGKAPQGAVVLNTVTNKIYVSNLADNSVTVIDGASLNTTAVAVKSPNVMAVNMVTNQVWVINAASSNVTMIDGATNNTLTLQTETPSQLVAVNPVTNKIFVTTVNYAVNVFDGATNPTTNIPLTIAPGAVAVNPVTNKIYVAAFNSGNNINVVDGLTNIATTVQVGSNPNYIAVNPVTNKIYVVNTGDDTVSVVDGQTNLSTTVAVGIYPSAIAINTVTNKIYVANEVSATVTVIDGPTNTTTTVSVGPFPYAIAINEVTNQIYVVNYETSLTVIDGVYNTSVELITGSTPYAVAVNPLTNKIYVTNYPNSDVTIIDGVTKNMVTVARGSGQSDVLVNPVNNKIYITNTETGQLTVIDGVSNSTTFANGNQNDFRMTINTVTNKIYVGNLCACFIQFIDGGTNATTVDVSGPYPDLPAINMVTNRIYLSRPGSSSLTVIDTGQIQPNSLTTTISPLPGNQTSSSTPNFTFTATSTTISQPSAVFYQVDNWENAWTPATGSNPTFAGSVKSLQPGFHILYAYATDGQDATSTSSGSPLTGTIQAYAFEVVPPNTNPSPSPTAPSVGYVAFWGVNNSGVTISWSTDVPATTFLTYGTTPALGQTTTTDTTLSSSHGFVFTTLQPGTTYYFKAQSTGANGVTGASGVYSFTTTGTVAPSITNVVVSSITSFSATITWNTDQPSSSQVNYGTSSAYGLYSSLNPAASTSHFITLTGLQSGVLYNFNAVSTNSAGGIGTSGNFTFTTLSVATLAPVISNLTVNNISSYSATVTWTTDQLSNSQIDYGPNNYRLVASDSAFTTTHSITIVGLTANTTYTVVVMSTNSSGYIAAFLYTTFTTTSSGGTPPYVGYVAFWGVNNSGVTISWSTDLPADTQLAYGTTKSLGQLTPKQTLLSNSHGVVLTGLNSGTTYYFVAQSTAANGATGYSSTYNFTTGGTPAITGPIITSVSAIGNTGATATVTWTTDQPSSSQVNYGTSTGYGSSSLVDTTPLTSHSITLYGLSTGVTYNFDVVSTNSSGISTTSGNFTFTKASASPTQPVISNVSSSGITSGSATLSWTTDQPASSLVNYGATVGYGSSSPLDSNQVTSHSVTLTNLSPNNAYNYDVVSANAGNLSTSSANYTFTTAPAPVSGNAPIVSYVAFWGVTGSGVTISWSTNTPTTTAVAYGTTTALGQLSPLQTTLSNAHGVVLAGLSPSTTYYFVAQSTDASGNTGYSIPYSFTTIAGLPVISALSVAPTANNSAVIGWTTSFPTYGFVQYGTAAGSYDRYSGQTNLTATPQCALPYVPSGVIHYQVVSSDASGNQVVSPDATFVEP